MLKKLKSYTLVILGSCLTASAFGLIVLPTGFAAGGVTGLSVLLQKIIPLPVSTMVLIINISLFLLGLIFVGKEFVFKTFLTSLIFPLVLEITQHIHVFSELAADSFVSSLLAGGILGLGCGLGDRTLGRLLLPVFAGFWKIMGRIRWFLCLPGKKFLKKAKILFALAEKWVTIRWNYRRQNRRKSGGVSHGRTKKSLPQYQARRSAQHPAAEDHRDPGYRVLYGSSGGPGLGPERHPGTDR